MRKGRESAIPVGSQFTPALFDLPSFLEVLVTHSGDKQAIEEGIWKPGVRIKSASQELTPRRKSLPVEAAVQYGLLESKTYEATEIARGLVGLDDDEAYLRFARHILLERGGLRVVEAIQQMQADGLSVTGDSLAKYLSDQGFTVGVHNTAINSLRMWLAEAGMFPRGRKNAWMIDLKAKERVVGFDDETIQVLSGLTSEQRAFVEGLCAIDPRGWYPANDVRNWAETNRGIHIGRQSLPNQVLRVLQEAGIIEFDTRKGTQTGKASLLRTTDKFKKEVLAPFVTQTIKDLDPIIRRYYKERPEDIYAGLESKNTYEKGRALEAYAVHVMRLLRLRFLAWRQRATPSAHAEVDAVFAGVSGAVPTRWQIQCKNTPSSTVRLEDVAKEVGLLPVTKATHILIIANCDYTSDAVKYAQQVMKHSPVTIVLFGKKDFQEIRKSPGSIGQILRVKSEAIVRQADKASIFEWK